MAGVSSAWAAGSRVEGSIPGRAEGLAIPQRPGVSGATGEIAWNDKQGHAAPVAAPGVFFRGRCNYVQAAGAFPPTRREAGPGWLKKPAATASRSGRRQRGQTAKRVPITNRRLAAARGRLTRWQSSSAGRATPGAAAPQGIRDPHRKTRFAQAGHAPHRDLRFSSPGGADPRCELHRVDFLRGPGGYAAAAGHQSTRQVGLRFNAGGTRVFLRHVAVVEPVAMRTHLKGDGSGTGLRALGSHFQFFARQVGTIGLGEQVIVCRSACSPAGSTWGRHDGVVRLRCGCSSSH